MSTVLGCRSPGVALDAKRRVMLPVHLRQGLTLEDGVFRFYIGHEEDPCLYVHTQEQHERYVAELRDLFGAEQEDDRDAIRVILGNFVKVSTDAQGRLTVTEEHKAHGHLDSEVEFLAGTNRMEIWDPALLDRRRRAAQSKSYASLAARRRARAASMAEPTRPSDGGVGG